MNGTKCKACELLELLYNRTPKSNKDFWLMTELFILLHGSDTCGELKVFYFNGDT